MSSQEEESEPGQKNNQLLQLEEKTHKEEKKERGVSSKTYAVSSNTEKKLDEIYRKVPRFESASTLQHSIKNIYFDKQIRFRNAKNDSTDALYSIPESNTNISAIIGTSRRKPLYIDTRTPSPNAYHLQSVFEENLKSKRGAFLISRTQEKKKDNYPGPGAYNNKISWTRQNPIQMGIRHSFFYEDNLKGRAVVSPQRYRINRESVEQNRYHEIGIGYGKRGFGYGSFTPGVGSYNLPKMLGLNKFPIN